MSITVLAEERREWKQHPVTQEFLETLKASRQEAMEAWAAGAYTGETAEATLAANTAALGGMRLLSQVIESIETAGSDE